MKQLTIEEKAKAYDEALKRAIKHHDKDGLTLEQYETIDIIFPELKEEENEKIKKDLIHYFSDGEEFLCLCSFSREEIIDWLEKQGEQIDTLKTKEVDFEKEWEEYFKYRGDVATVNIKHLAKHFFELGIRASNPIHKNLD